MKSVGFIRRMLLMHCIAAQNWIYSRMQYRSGTVATSGKGSVWIELILLKLKTENWKHCSKIIFKWVDSAVWPIFNENVDKKWSLWDPWIVHKCTVHRRTGQPLRLKEKKKKTLRKHRRSTNKCYPNEHKVWTSLIC